MSDQSGEGDAMEDWTGATPPDPLSTYGAEIVVSQDAPAECTIYPTDIPTEKRITTWISAQEGSFVSLADRR